MTLTIQPTSARLVETLEPRRLLAVLTVDTLSDVTDPDDGLTTLREAIAAAASGDEIRFDDALIDGGSAAIVLEERQLDVDLGDDTSLTITGPGAGLLAIDGGYPEPGLTYRANRVLRLTSGSLDISGLTFQHGNAGGPGGGLSGEKGTSLTLREVIVERNYAFEYGGGVHSAGDLTLIDSIVRENQVHNGEFEDELGIVSGGGIFSRGRSFTMIGSTVSNNLIRAYDEAIGAGLDVVLQQDDSSLRIERSTIADNENYRPGSLLVEFGAARLGAKEVTLIDTTVTNNISRSDSGYVYVDSESVYAWSSPTPLIVRGLLVAGNTVADDTLEAFIGSSSSPGVYIPSDVSHSFFAGGARTVLTDLENGERGNIVGTPAAPLNARLGTLGNYGGFTPTVPLLRGSPAVGANDPDAASATDQRGAPRDGAPDIGSFELQNAAPELALPASITVPEDTPIGTVLATMSASDADAGDTLVYSIDDGDDEPFAIDGETGEVTLIGPLDYELAVSHTLTIRVTDAMGASDTVGLTINVTDVGPSVQPGDKPGRARIELPSGDAPIAVSIGRSGDDAIVRINGEAVVVSADYEAIYLDFGDGDDVVTIESGGPALWLNLGGGNDTIVVEGSGGGPKSFLAIDGGAGDDLIVGTAGPDCLRGGDGDDTIRGGGGEDYLLGGAGTDELFGGGGDDTLDGGLGDDRLDGGAGRNVLSYRGRSDAVSVDLAAGTGGGDGEADTFANVRDLIGGDGDDALVGDAQGNFILGRGGNDTLRGGAGSDSLLGGAGEDWLYGGDDDDRLLTKRALPRDGDDAIDHLFGGDGRDVALADDDDQADPMLEVVTGDVDAYIGALA